MFISGRKSLVVSVFHKTFYNGLFGVDLLKLESANSGAANQLLASVCSIRF